MANYGAILRPSAIASSARAHARSTRKAISKFARPQSFSFPPNPSAAAARAARNLSYFRIHYGVVLWIVLLASLAPRRRASMLFLMAVAKIALLYQVLRRAVPGSSILHRILDGRLVLGVFLIVVLVELAVTRAIGQLAMAVGIGVPIVLIHAVFRVADDLVPGSEEGAADGEPVDGGEKKDGDLESGSR